MTEPVRLFIATDNAERACMAVLSCALSDCPPFVRIVTDAAAIAAIPEGARCIGQWFAWSDRKPDEAQMAWDDRKARGGIEGVSEAFFQRIDEWNAKRREAEARILAEAVAELSDAPVTSFSDLVNAQAAAHAVESDKVAVLPKQSGVSRWK
ncbi:hypothetical protein B5K11_09630 [Rhizobium leguminosarum bv. trifolii]|uniref:hypothetical protein n=1 Tax=Rhizobium leguminosarum TaxID=384 RepID=UPI000E2E8B6D|nr:hypothetical protein [Rhizobium leguminosarum]RFB95203.1 hypothetical protein B5K11_09630 [Rhizobium leguminosarum bv. trifolii]